MGDILKMDLEEQTELADKYDKKNLDFEDELYLALVLLFEKIGRDFEKVFSVTGESISANDYLVELQDTLKHSYDQVGEYYSNHFDRELKKQIAEADEDSELAKRSALILLILSDSRDEINRALERVNIFTIRRQSSFIIETTEQIILDSVDQARKELGLIIPEGETVTNKAISKKAGDILNEANVTRSRTIAETEVGIAGGIGGQTESDILNGVLASEDLADLIITKRWISRLDNVVREAHLVAHGQTKELKDPFEVGGESLMFPKDTSLGASLGNIINCRCLSINT